MADSQSQAVKCLNTGPSRKRFIFKTFSQRVEEIDIGVFRSLTPLKAEPSTNSFFHDALVEWRELNTAEDFISFYEDTIPLVQTLPQILLQQEKIFSGLVRRLHVKAKLSLEPLLMLIAAVSRDIQKDFLLFLPRLSDAFVDLLRNGGDRDPEILELVFTSWSHIMMYLQQYLVKDVVHVLKITVNLRFFPKDYVQEFMAEAVSFLLRNSSVDQLIKGIRKTAYEVAKSSSSVRKAGVSALLWHVLRGTSSKLHSRAEKVLRLLIDKSTFSIADKFDQGWQAILEVLTGAIHRICKEVESKELNVLYNCLYEEISSCISDGCLVHIGRLLRLLTFTVCHGCKRSDIDIKRVLKLVRLLTESYVLPNEGPNGNVEVRNRVLQLMLCLLDVPNINIHLPSISLLYAPVFKLRDSSLLMFIKELILKDPCVIQIFKSDIMSAMSDLIEASPDEIIFLMLTFFEKQGKQQSGELLFDVPEDKVLKVCNFFKETFFYWEKLIREITRDPASMQFSESNLAVLWGALSCCPQFQHQNSLSLIRDMIDTLDKLLETESDSIAGLPRSTWQSLLGNTLIAYDKLLVNGKARTSEANGFLHLARRHKSSQHVLFAAAEFLDAAPEPTIDADTKTVLRGLGIQEAVNSISLLTENLGLPNKAIRISTLRILSHHASLNQEAFSRDERPHKKLKTEESGSFNEDSQYIDVIELLLLVETAPLKISESRKIVILITKVQMALTSGRIYHGYMSLLLNGLIGILHNRLGHLWEPAVECLAVLIGKYKEVVWDEFVQHLENHQLRFLASDDHLAKFSAESLAPDTLNDCLMLFLSSDYDSTPCMTVTTLLLQSLQKIPDIAESRSRQLIPLFFTFLGYANAEIYSVDSFNTHNCKRKEWRALLKEWLNLLKLMRNARSLYRSHILKEVLANRFPPHSLQELISPALCSEKFAVYIGLLEEIDPDIQSKVLDCLLNWRDDFLIPYEQHLKNLIISKNLREELTTWAVSKDSLYIQEGHRAHLIPIIVRLLSPKVRKLKALGSRKHAGINQRRAVLCFLSHLDIDELQVFFSLLMKPLLTCPCETGVVDSCIGNSSEKLTGKSRPSVLVNSSALVAISNLPWKKRYGFLHVVEDILKTFDESHIKPFLNSLMEIVVRLLESCMVDLINQRNKSPCDTSDNSTCDLESHDAHDMAPSSPTTSASIKQVKDLRSVCLKIIAVALNKYGSHDLGSNFWDVFFTSVKPLIDSFKQEGASSERPSSLFCCFVAMSQSPILVSLLAREANLVPTIFSILTVKTASDAIKSYVLYFVENLLNLDNDLDPKDDSVQTVLLPHLETLLHGFHGFFLSRKDFNRKAATWSGKTELRILKLLVKYIKNPLAAGQYVDMLLPFFKKKTLNLDECMECLQIIQSILPVVSDKTTGTVLDAINPLLLYVGLDQRMRICDVLNCLALKDSSLSFLAQLLNELNAISSSDIGDADYDTRLNAYTKIKPETFSQFTACHASMILSHCVYDISSEELIFRQSASRALLSFVQFASSVLNRDIITCQDMLSHDVTYSNTADLITETIDTSTRWTKASIQKIIRTVFLDNIGKAMSKQGSIQKEWIDLLRIMIYNLHEIPALNSFGPLCSEDAEIDFFNNIIHLQINRRVNALTRFRKALPHFKDTITDTKLTENITEKIFIPMFFNMLFDGKGEHLRVACVETLASIAGQMQWKSYSTFLMRCFHEMTLKPDKEKILLKLLRAALDVFHFYEASSHRVVEDAKCEVLHSDSLERNSSALPSDVRDVTSEIQVYLKTIILPQIQKLVTKDSEKVNVASSTAALKLLKLLPAETLESHLPAIIHRICNFLRHRLESVRMEARSALVECIHVLGLEYIQFIVKVMRGALKRGFELHVLGYTLNFILTKILVPTETPKKSRVCKPTEISDESMVGKLDYCLEELLSVAENDILGDVSEEKEVEKIASKMKETRKNKSFDTLKLISKNIIFGNSSLKLLSPTNSHLHKHLTPKAKAKLEMMLHHIASGINENKSAKPEELFVFVYGLIEDSVSSSPGREEATSMTEICNTKALKWTDKTNTICHDNSRSQNYYLIVVFAFEVLHNCLKGMKLDKKDEQLLSMLDPFVRLLVDYLNSKHEDIISAAFRCLARLIRLPLPSLEARADKIKVILLDICQKSGSTSSPLTQSCLKLLTELLERTKISLSNSQLHMLVQFPLFIDLQKNPSPVALSLLKPIIFQKLVVPEIYDIVTRVAELIVTSQSEPIRRKCRQILLQFLLDYRLSDKRLQQHLDFLLTNLSYEHSSGRESVLEMLNSIVDKFPRSVVDGQAQTFFLHLVVALANDQDPHIRNMAAEAIKGLINHTSQHTLQSILESSLSWYMGEKRHLWCAAAQVLSLLVEVLEKGFQRHIRSILRTAKGIMEMAVDATSNKELESDEPVISFWKEAYYSLLMFKEMLIHFPDIYLDRDLEEIWEMVIKFLLHPHTSLRHVSSSLLALYFAAVPESSQVDPLKSDLAAGFLFNPRRLFTVAVSFVNQIRAPLHDVGTSNFITHNLVFSISHLHSFLGKRHSSSPHEFWSNLDPCEQGSYLEAFDLLGSGKAKNLLLLSTSSTFGSSRESNQTNLDGNEKLRQLIVSPIIKRMGKLALQMENIQMKIVFNCFKMLSSQLGSEGCHDYAIHMLHPLYKVCEGFSGKVISDETKQLAEEVRDSISSVLGVDRFVHVYNAIRRDLKDRRDKRKHEQKVVAVIDPMRYAKRKLQTAAKHRAHKKRKLTAMKIGRWRR